MKRIKGFTLEEVMQKVQWVARYTSGYRDVGLYDDVSERMKKNEDSSYHEVKDFDIVCREGQPVELHEFFDEMVRIEKENGWMTLMELFEMFGVDDNDPDDNNDANELGYELPKDKLLAVIKAGNATVTLHSGTTGKHYTYNVKKHNSKNVWFVSLMTGTNNDEDFSYMGFFYHEAVLKHSDKSCVRINHPAYLAFDYFLKHINNIPEKLGVYHAGKCCRCGRTLTTPRSVKNGIGPECIKMMGVA